MNKRTIEIMDTTLRDGEQTSGSASWAAPEVLGRSATNRSEEEGGAHAPITLLQTHECKLGVAKVS